MCKKGGKKGKFYQEIFLVHWDWNFCSVGSVLRSENRKKSVFQIVPLLEVARVEKEQCIVVVRNK